MESLLFNIIVSKEGVITITKTRIPKPVCTIKGGIVNVYMEGVDAEIVMPVGSTVAEAFDKVKLRLKRVLHSAETQFNNMYRAVDKYKPPLLPGESITVSTCQYSVAWRGLCGETVRGGGKFCVKHNNLICAGCGGPAVRSCPDPGQLVCGYPLCDTCIHIGNSNQCNHGPAKELKS